MVGFSAGAMLTLQTALRGPDAKPAFIGIIYGPLEPVTVPADAPPLFVALAADDPIFGGRGMGLIQSWMTAKRPGGVPSLRAGRARFRNVPQGNHEHRLVRRLCAMAWHARAGEADALS